MQKKFTAQRINLQLIHCERVNLQLIYSKRQNITCKRVNLQQKCEYGLEMG